MNTRILKNFGLIQILDIIIYIYLYNLLTSRLTFIIDTTSSPLMSYEVYVINARFLIPIVFFSTILLIGGSIPFAFYLNFNKFILIFGLGVGIDFFQKFYYYFLFLFYNESGFPLELLIFPTILLSMLLCLISLKVRPNYKEKARIKTEILNISTNYPDFKVIKISKKCRVDKNTVINSVKEMIENREIYADYFKNSRKFAFNNIVNTEKIDELMNLYRKWEKEKLGKVSL